MVEENTNQYFRLKNIVKKNCFFKEIKQNKLMSKKHKKVYTILNYFEHSVMFASTITGFISISAFARLIAIARGITSSAIGSKICAIIAGIIKYKSFIKKRKRNTIK